MKEGDLMVCVDPGSRNLTKGKVYMILKKDRGRSGEPMVWVIGDNGDRNHIFLRSFKPALPLSSFEIDLRAYLSEELR